MSISDSLENVQSIGLFSGDMNGNNSINTVDTNNVYNFSLNRRPLLTLKGAYCKLNDTGTEISYDIQFKHIHKYNLTPYREFVYSITPWINNVERTNLKHQFVISDPEELNEKIYSYTHSNTIPGSFNVTDTIQFKVEYKVIDDPGTFYTNNFNFKTPNFRMNVEYNFGELGLFSGDMNGNNKINTVDTNNMYNFSLNRRPILSLQGIRNSLNINTSELVTEFKFAQIHKYNLNVFREFKYFIIPIIDGVNYPEEEFLLNEFNVQETIDTPRKVHHFIYEHTTSGTFTNATTVQYKITYKPLEDNYIYISGFNYKTPLFTIGEPTFDLNPGFSLKNYENNASIIAVVLDENDINVVTENDRLVIYDENNNIHSSEILSLPKNTPSLIGNNENEYYFAGVLGIEGNNYTFKLWKYDNGSNGILHSLETMSVLSNTMLGTPNNPLILRMTN